MQTKIDDIENEIKHADSVLVNVYRMESETSSLHKKLSYYQSFKYEYLKNLIIELPRWIKYLFLQLRKMKVNHPLHLNRNVKDYKMS